jgi:two-component system, probable response regulator PhcQ
MTKAFVICVDDDEALLASVARTLRREPTLDVRTTMEPEQVLEWIASEDIAVLVSDYEMPAITGAQLAGKAKRVRPETVRILLTGKHTLDTAIDGINQGEIFRFIKKPFEEKYLRQTVLEAVARHDELVAMSGERARAERRKELHAALEAEYPGISQVVRTDDVLVVTEDPWQDAIALGIAGLDRKLES